MSHGNMDLVSFGTASLRRDNSYKGHIFFLLYLFWATFGQGTNFFFVVDYLLDEWKKLGKGHIFFLMWSICGTHFFFDVVHMWDIFFEVLNCKSASRTLRSLRSRTWFKYVPLPLIYENAYIIKSLPIT